MDNKVSNDTLICMDRMHILICMLGEMFGNTHEDNDFVDSVDGEDLYYPLKKHKVLFNQVQEGISELYQKLGEDLYHQSGDFKNEI